MEPAEARDQARAAAALWSVGYIQAIELVRAACDLLVTGHDGPTLAMLAGVHTSYADEEVPDLLEAALGDVGLYYYPPGSQEGAKAAVRTLAQRVVDGTMEPSALTVWAHSPFSHEPLDLAERLVELDDAYDYLEVSDITEEELDADVIAEARRIAASTNLSRARSR